MREAKRKWAEEDMNSFLLGGGDGEADTLNGRSEALLQGFSEVRRPHHKGHQSEGVAEGKQRQARA